MKSKHSSIVIYTVTPANIWNISLLLELRTVLSESYCLLVEIRLSSYQNCLNCHILDGWSSWWHCGVCVAETTPWRRRMRNWNCSCWTARETWLRPSTRCQHWSTDLRSWHSTLPSSSTRHAGRLRTILSRLSSAISVKSSATLHKRFACLLRFWNLISDLLFL